MKKIIKKLQDELMVIAGVVLFAILLLYVGWWARVLARALGEAVAHGSTESTIQPFDFAGFEQLKLK